LSDPAICCPDKLIDSRSILIPYGSAETLMPERVFSVGRYLLNCVHDEPGHAPATGAELEVDREMTDGIDMVDASEPEPAPFRPSEEWIDAFKKQCTDAMRLDLRAYAGRRARGVGRAGAHVDDSYANDLVANALADTLF
jgi:hypothetical protein